MIEWAHDHPWMTFFILYGLVKAIGGCGRGGDSDYGYTDMIVMGGPPPETFSQQSPCSMRNWR